ncbi:MAG: hypothetical protein LUF92_01560 [Clostridiales bacterium]|nr:hypothetical protein [Clostridiales bacterium]
MSSNSKMEASMEAAFEHAQEHLDACRESSQNTEIAKGTYTFPEKPHGSGMVRDPES